MSRRVLFVCDEQSSLREECSVALNVVSECTQWDSLAPERLRDRNVDLIVAVAIPHCLIAKTFFDWLIKNPIGKPLLAVLPADDNLVQAAAQVVDDFVISPVRADELVHRVTRILGNQPTANDTENIQERLSQEFGLRGFVGEDPEFLRAIGRIPLLARSNSTVLITGETGTGKELCAHAIHHLGPRRNFPFIPVDCAALPDHLFENEMFGHARGAFTDAHREQKGVVALADGGTLFLDEVDSLSAAAQSKLLRFLQDHTYRPLGSDKFVRANVNVVAATNRDLEAMVCRREFRSDLFFRLNVLRLRLSPLRERRGDIPLLARHFVEDISLEVGLRKTLAPATIRKLNEHDWPGNVRELNNVIKSAVVFSEGNQILPSHIPFPTVNRSLEATRGGFRDARTRAIQTFERRYVEELLLDVGGNVTRAARIAQKDRRAFGRLIKRYNIKREQM